MIKRAKLTPCVFLIQITKSPQKVFETFKKVARSGCKVSYVECPIVKQLGKYFFSYQRRQQFEEIQSFLDLKRKDHLIRSKVVYFNLPPIEIHHLYFI